MNLPSNTLHLTRPVLLLRRLEVLALVVAVVPLAAPGVPAVSAADAAPREGHPDQDVVVPCKEMNECCSQCTLRKGITLSI